MNLGDFVDQRKWYYLDRGAGKLWIFVGHGSEDGDWRYTSTYLAESGGLPIWKLPSAEKVCDWRGVEVNETNKLFYHSTLKCWAAVYVVPFDTPMRLARRFFDRKKERGEEERRYFVGGEKVEAADYLRKVGRRVRGRTHSDSLRR